MGALRKAGVWLGLIEDDDDRGYDQRGYDDDYDDEEVAVVRTRSSERLAESARPAESRLAESRLGESSRLAESREAREALRAERAASVRPLTRGQGGSTTYPTRDNLALAPQVQMRERAALVEEEERRYQITTLHPTTYNEARTIGEHFRDGVPVIMNLTEMAEADAKRLVDFAAGLAFGLRGTMERVTNRVFLLSPANVQVTAEDKARIAEGGFFNQS